jgi:hypothetical protein
VQFVRVSIARYNFSHLLHNILIQKIEITPKRLEIGIHNVNKSGLKIKFYIHI